MKVLIIHNKYFIDSLMKYIYHHLGLGFHIICNGLVRSLINFNERYVMFVKEPNLTFVKFMYRDLNNLEFEKRWSNFYVIRDLNKEENFTYENRLCVSGF